MGVRSGIKKKFFGIKAKKQGGGQVVEKERTQFTLEYLVVLVKYLVVLERYLVVLVKFLKYVIQ